MKILIVDDDQAVRAVLRSIIERRGQEAMEAVDGQEGLAKALQHKPDAIISDALMPRMDGFQLLKAVRRDETLGFVPFIFYTAIYTEDKERELALSFGADAVIAKPKNPDAFWKEFMAALEANAVKKKRAVPTLPAGREEDDLKNYSYMVVSKLEAKVKELETTIAEHELTKTILRESEKRYRFLFENNPQPMWVYDLETLAFLAVNEAAVIHYGYSREEFLSMAIKNIRPPEDVPYLVELISRKVPGVDTEATVRHRKKDGTIIDVEITSQSLLFLGRSARLVLANDVTDRMRLERAIHAAADEWRSTFDAMSDAIALLDKSGKILRCNRAMTSLLKKEFHEIVGRQCWEVIQGTEGPAPGCPYETMKKTLKRETIVAQINDRWFDVAADPFFDAEGNLLGAVHIMADITERKRSEDLLSKVVRQQKAILNNIPDIAWLKDGEGKFIAVNEPFGKASGVKPDELPGKTDLDIWPRELAERYRSDDREVMLSGKRKIVEEPLADKSGKTEWIETIKTPIYDEKGSVIGTTGIARDITERRKAEEALRASEEMHRLIYKGSPVGIFHYDADLIITDCNDRFSEILKTKRETLIGLDMHTLRDQRVLPPLKTAISGKESRYEGPYKAAKNFAEIWVSMRTAPLFDQDGKVIVGVAIVEDISERKYIEDRLKTSEEKFRTLFESANDAIFVLDEKGHFIDVNTIAYERLGYTKEELLSKQLSQLVSPEFAIRVPEKMSQIMKYGHAVFESAHIKKDGAIMPVEINARFVDFNGRKVQFSIARDISARKLADETIKRNLQIQNVLNSLLKVSLEGIPLKELLEKALDIILSVPFLPLMPKGGIFVVEDAPEVLILTANRGFSVPIQEICASVPFGRCLCGRAAADKQLQFADCLDERHENSYDGIIPHGHYNVPILSMGRVLGVIVLYLHEGHQQDKSEIEFLQAVADTLAGIIERKRAEEGLKQYSKELLSLAEASNVVLTTVTTLYDTICDVAVRNFGLKMAWLGLVDKGSFNVKPVAHAGFEDDYLSGIKATWDDSPTGMGPSGI